MAAIVGEKSPPGCWNAGTSTLGSGLTGQASILSFTRQLIHQEKKEMQEKHDAARRVRIAARLSREEQPRMLKRKPAGRPREALCRTGDSSCTPPSLHADSQPISQAAKKKRKLVDGTNNPKAGQMKTAKAANNEGASMTSGRRPGRPPGSKNNPKIGWAVMQKAEVQAKA
eukprot:363074-Chlamydomonas_euryale.AAC.21